MELAGERQTRLILQKKYQSVGCFYCKQDAHTYHNCPSRPCFLCKQSGHVSALCPHNTSVSNTRLKLPSHTTSNKLRFTRSRELTSAETAFPYIPSYEPMRTSSVVSVAQKAHPSRVTAAEWMPDASAVLSGDKRGTMRVWHIPSSSYTVDGSLDVERLSTMSNTSSPSNISYLNIHRCNINSFVFDDTNRAIVYTTSGDGMVCQSRVDFTRSTQPLADNNDSHVSSQDNAEILLNTNPNGWVSPSTWRMTYGLAYDPLRQSLYAGISDGSIARVDPRSNDSDTTPVSQARFHSGKVTTIHVNPSQPNLLATASNDSKVCFWDARKFIPNSPLGYFAHDRVVCSAFFSPITGSKLLTTSFDNRIRVWNDINVFQGDANAYKQSQPDHTIIHSHDFHRHITPFKAVWDPKDWNEELFVCGRFLGEAYSDTSPDQTHDESHQDKNSVLLRPVDLFSARSGAVQLSLVDRSLPLICTINRFCPKADIILSAASTGLYLWSSQSDAQRREHMRRHSGHENDDARDYGDDDDGGGKKKKKRKLRLTVLEKDT